MMSTAQVDERTLSVPIKIGKGNKPIKPLDINYSNMGSELDSRKTFDH